MGASPVAKEIKISITADIKQMATEIKNMSSMFAAEMGRMKTESTEMSKNLNGALRMVVNEMEGLNDRFKSTSSNIFKMRGEMKEAFGGMGQLLVENNTKVLKMVSNLAALHQQTRTIAAANKTVKESDPFDATRLAASFAGMKLLNMAWNGVTSSISSAKNELIEFEKTTKAITSMSGENLEKVQSQIFSLSNSSGMEINKIAKAIQDSTNEGNTLTASFEKINAAIILSNKNMGSLANNIARVDDIVDQFGVSADKALATVLGKNLSSERALAIFGRLARDAKEANIEFDQFSSILNIMANKAGIAERSLQIGFRALLNGLQEVGEVGQKTFFEQILPNWQSLNSETKRSIELHLGLRQNDEFLKVLGNRWGEISEDIKKSNSHLAKFGDLSEAPVTFAKTMNSLWNSTLMIINDLIRRMSDFTGANSILQKFADKIAGIAKHVTGDITINAELGIAIQAISKDLDIAEKRLKAFKEGFMGGRPEDISAQQRVVTLLKEELKDKQRTQQILIENEIIEERRASTFGKTAKTYKEATNDIINSFKKEMKEGMFNPFSFSNPEDANKAYVKDYKKDRAQIELETSGLAISQGRSQVLTREIELNRQLLSTLSNRRSMEVTLNHDRQYTETIDKEIVETTEKILDLTKKLADENKRNDSSAKKAAAKDIKDVDQELQKYITNQRNSIKLAFDSHEITSQNAHQSYEYLKAETVKMKDQEAAKKIIIQLDRDKLKLQEDYNKSINDLNGLFKKSEQKDHILTMREDLETRKLLIKAETDHKLTKAEAIKLLQDEVAIRKLEVDGEANAAAILTARQEYQQIYNRLKQEAINLTNIGMTAEAARVTQEITNAQLIRDTKVNAIQSVIQAEGELQAKKNETSDIEKVAATSFANGVNNVMNTAITKLITNTGDLAHVWKNFFQQFMVDIAKALAKQALLKVAKGFFGASTGGIGSIIMGALGGAKGTTLTGVPGYAMGTPMKGVDTVPAMLSPGEIVLDNNASDMFRGAMRNGGFGGQGQTIIIIQSNPSLLGNREEIIRLDNALNNPSIRTSIDRKRV